MADTSGVSQLNQCPRCSRDMTLRESLSTSIGEVKNWLAAHPYVGGDLPLLNNIKQMLMEGCDFASVVIWCIDGGRVVPAYANFRLFIDRWHLADYFARRSNDVSWEYQSMARIQQVLDRKMQDAPPKDRKWIKRRLKSIWNWNRKPHDGGKPMSMRKPGDYHFDPGPMPPQVKEWRERCSQFVHPTFNGEQDVGRRFIEDEADTIIREVHWQLCFTLLYAQVFEDQIPNRGVAPI